MLLTVTRPCDMNLMSARKPPACTGSEAAELDMFLKVGLRAVHVSSQVTCLVDEEAVLFTEFDSLICSSYMCTD